jgi:hypothetical protein
MKTLIIIVALFLTVTLAPCTAVGGTVLANGTTLTNGTVISKTAVPDDGTTFGNRPVLADRPVAHNGSEISGEIGAPDMRAPDLVDLAARPLARKE